MFVKSFCPTGGAWRTAGSPASGTERALWGLPASNLLLGPKPPARRSSTAAEALARGNQPRGDEVGSH